MRRAEDLSIRLEADDGATPIGCRADVLELGRRAAALETLDIRASVARDFHFHPFRQGVYDGSADTMQSARSVVDLAAELSSGMEHGHDDFERRFVLELRMGIDRNSSAVIP